MVLTRSAVVFPSEEAKAGSFAVVCEKRRLVFATSNNEDREEWISLIDAAIKSSPYITSSEQFGDSTEEENNSLDSPIVASSQELEEGGGSNEPKANKSGWLEKQDRRKKEWQRRWFVQKGPILSYYADDKQTKMLGRIILTIDDSIVSPKAMNNDYSAPLPFIIQTSEGRKVSLMAPNKIELMDWVSELKRAASNSTSFVKPSSMAEFSETEDGELTDTSGVPVNAALQGWLEHQSGKTWRRRHFVLQKDMITYFRTPMMTRYCGQMVLRYGDQIAVVQDERDHPYCFTINASYPPRRLKVSAQSKEELELWTRTLLASIPKQPTMQDDFDYLENSEPEVLAKASEENPAAIPLAGAPVGAYKGWLLKYSEPDKAWKKRYFVHEDMLFTYFKTDKVCFALVLILFVSVLFLLD